MSTVTLSGKVVSYQAAVEMMGDEICAEPHQELAPCTDQELENVSWADMVSANEEGRLTLQIVQGVYPDAIGFSVNDEGRLSCLYKHQDPIFSDWWRDEAWL